MSSHLRRLLKISKLAKRNVSLAIVGNRERLDEFLSLVKFGYGESKVSYFKDDINISEFKRVAIFDLDWVKFGQYFEMQRPLYFDMRPKKSITLLFCEDLKTVIRSIPHSFSYVSHTMFLDKR